MVKNRRALGARLTAALAGSLAALALSSPSAFAWSNSYCGVLINQGTWCGDGSDHSYDYNRASYGGNGTVYVCERLLWANSTRERLTPSCSYNYNARNYGATSSLFEAEVTHIYSGGARHTIYGYAVA